MGLVAACSALAARAAPALLHLTRVSPMLEPLLEAAAAAAAAGGGMDAGAAADGQWALPRMAGGSAAASGGEAAVIGISSFAFQVRPMPALRMHHCSCGLCCHPVKALAAGRHFGMGRLSMMSAMVEMPPAWDIDTGAAAPLARCHLLLLVAALEAAAGCSASLSS